MRFRGDDLRRQDWAPPQTLQIPDWCGCSTEYLPVPAGDGWWALVPIWEPSRTPNPLADGSPLCPTGRRILTRSHERRTSLTAMPLERQPGPPRIVVERIEGRDTLYEFDLAAAPSPAWRAAFLRLPPSLITANRTPEVGRVAIHGATVPFRTGPQHLEAWLRRIDRRIGYANAVIKE